MSRAKWEKSHQAAFWNHVIRTEPDRMSPYSNGDLFSLRDKTGSWQNGDTNREVFPDLRIDPRTREGCWWRKPEPNKIFINVLAWRVAQNHVSVNPEYYLICRRPDGGNFDFREKLLKILRCYVSQNLLQFSPVCLEKEYTSVIM